MQYLQAERTLADAERTAWKSRDFDTLSRLYMPLQEARRQRRQRCGEGVVCLDLLAQGPDDILDGRHVVENYPQGQLLVAGWQSIEPAAQVRKLQAEHDLFLDTFLAAVYPVGRQRMVVIVPLAESRLPQASFDHLEQLQAELPAHCLVFAAEELPAGIRRGNAQTYGQVMDLWEKLHTPFLAAADALTDPLRKIEACRKTLRVDYACELAHQHIAEIARNLARQ